MNENNHVEIAGKIVTPIVQNYNYKNDKVYETSVEVMRLSGVYDVLPITIKSEFLKKYALKVGDRIRAEGQVRTYNRRTEHKVHVLLTIFVKKLIEEEKEIDKDDVVLDGFICKEPEIHTTPFGRVVSHLILTVNRPGGKSDYVPCVCWGNNANFAYCLKPGDRIRVKGRMQSRKYIKKFPTGEEKEMTTYEMSVGMIERL